jgi:death-on-curing protein
MISTAEVIYIHELLIKRFNGSEGIRDIGLLESALARPFQTFDGADLYPDVIEKAAALIQSLLNNHPFVDGNKRIGYVIMRLFIIESGNDILASQSEKYDFVIKIASGDLDFEGIRNWIETKAKYKK